jgi:arylsulfatase A-like enzyme
MEVLRDAGYQTHGAGKMHFSPDPFKMWGFESRDISEEGLESGDQYAEFIMRNGYSHVLENLGARSEYYYLPQLSQLPSGLHNSTWVGDRAIEFLRHRDRRRPFLLWTSWIKPHPPFESPAPWYKLYRCEEMDSPFVPPTGGELLNFWNRIQNRYKYRDAGSDQMLLRTMRAAYYACISFVDYNVGRVLDALGDDIDNTLVLFTSDHGELLGDYGSFGKRCMLDPAARIPMLARFPKSFRPGSVCDTPTSLLDVWPTLMDVAGISGNKVCNEGSSLTEIAGGNERDRTVFSQFQQRHAGLYMAVDRQWKYIYSAADRREWLLNRADNRRETENLAANPRYSQEIGKMRGCLLSRFEKDGYDAAVEDGAWRQYAQPQFPEDPDAGLLYQDGGRLQEEINRLGKYCRDVTRPDPEAIRLIYDLIQLTSEKK